MVSCRDHCNPILIPPISRGAGASERATGGERQTARKRHGDVKSSEGEIISPPCTVYPPQSISSLSLLFPLHVERKQPPPPPLSHTRLSHSYLFSPPSLVLSLLLHPQFCIPGTLHSAGGAIALLLPPLAPSLPDRHRFPIDVPVREEGGEDGGGVGEDGGEDRGEDGGGGGRDGGEDRAEDGGEDSGMEGGRRGS